MTNLPFGERLRSTRKRLRLTQTTLAHRLQVSAQSISNWEAGRNKPWPREQLRLLAALDKIPSTQAPAKTVERRRVSDLI